MVDFNKLKLRLPVSYPKTPSTILAITGHRPNKLGGYDINNAIRPFIRGAIKAETAVLLGAKNRNNVQVQIVNTETEDQYRNSFLDSYFRRVKWNKPMPTDVLCLSGMALGVDQDAADTWITMGIPFLAVVPFPSQKKAWPKQSQLYYDHIISKAHGVINVSEENPTSDDDAIQKLHKRNEWMCAVANKMLAIFDGSKGGTSGCIYNWRRINMEFDSLKIVRPIDCLDNYEPIFISVPNNIKNHNRLVRKK